MTARRRENTLTQTPGHEVAKVNRRCALTDESGLGDEVSDGNWDLLHDVLTDHLDVVLELG